MLRETIVPQQTQVLSYGPRFSVAKRLFDVGVCLAVLPFALLAMLLIASAIFMDSAGPVIFIQERIGRGGRRFRMYKFRTMRADHDALANREFMTAFVRGVVDHLGDGRPTFKPIRKEQITRIGRILRKTSLDELPQVFNVLRGEMSLVGPRPNVPWEVEAYQDWHQERLEALPGITGLAQVRGRSGITFDSIVKYDIEYIRQYSLKLDLQIMWWTVLSVLTGRGAG